MSSKIPQMKIYLIHMPQRMPKNKMEQNETNMVNKSNKGKIMINNRYKMNREK